MQVKLVLLNKDGDLAARGDTWRQRHGYNRICSSLLFP